MHEYVGWAILSWVTTYRHQHVPYNINPPTRSCKYLKQKKQRKMSKWNLPTIKKRLQWKFQNCWKERHENRVCRNLNDPRVTRILIKKNPKCKLIFNIKGVLRWFNQMKHLPGTFQYSEDRPDSNYIFLHQTQI